MSPVVVVTGARQTGKTTLVKSLPSLAHHAYLTLDDFDLRTQASEDPEALVHRAPRLILDEVQREPSILIAIKKAVDEEGGRAPGRFVLTGSANLLMMQNIGDTLAGRAVYVTLGPFTRRERLGQGRAGCWNELLGSDPKQWPGVLENNGGPEEAWKKAALLGGFPVPSHQLATAEERSLWFSGYVQTYLERDLQSLKAVENLADFRRVMRAACLRIGGLVNQTDMARDAGISQAQVHRFLNLLETSHQLFRVPVYAVNRTKRLIKAPKLYWNDTALALHLAGEIEPRGEHLENLVCADLAAWRDTQAHITEILHWRTVTNLEVDFVVESGQSLLPIEVKASSKVTQSDVKGVEAFLDEYPEQAKAGLILYGGNETYPLTQRTLAVPWWRVL